MRACCVLIEDEFDGVNVDFVIASVSIFVCRDAAGVGGGGVVEMYLGYVLIANELDGMKVTMCFGGVAFEGRFGWVAGVCWDSTEIGGVLIANKLERVAIAMYFGRVAFAGRFEWVVGVFASVLVLVWACVSVSVCGGEMCLGGVVAFEGGFEWVVVVVDLVASVLACVSVCGNEMGLNGVVPLEDKPECEVVAVDLVASVFVWVISVFRGGMGVGGVVAFADKPECEVVVVDLVALVLVWACVSVSVSVSGEEMGLYLWWKSP
jgi:hypothetical protein